jgi:hypothetical protein
MPEGLYEHDILSWAEQQAALLGRLAAGERVNQAVDWPNVIEELRDVGLSELRACRSLLRQALAHLLKLHAWPESPAAAHWRGEAVGFLADARDRFSPSMRHRIEIADLYRAASDQVRAEATAPHEAPPLSAACPLTLDDLLAPRPDPVAILAKLAHTE